MQKSQANLFSPNELPLTWADVLKEEKGKKYFKDTLAFVEQERSGGKIIYPPNAEVFNALSLTPFSDVKAVILGQDPYHGAGQAHGLCFSVCKGIAKPPSLINIFKELESDLGISPPNHGCLESWAKEGVLLLNTVLTVEAGKPQSHQNKGWEIFTDRIIDELNQRRDGLVFLLWGSSAKQKAQKVDQSRHLVLSAPHPSPLSAHRGFLGCKHFSKANKHLTENGIQAINWAIDSF
ncbi:MAG: uracil-DNA glycosylase [Bdellovibrionales bacterium]|nr:uracil-DNA glycosylase [Bdellovibrionales bacterium]